MKKIKVLCVLLLVMIGLTGCKGEKTVEKDAIIPIEETMTPEPVMTASPKPTDTHKGEAVSRLTGQWISAKKANKRPYAVMINNIKAANPGQSGTSQASVLYEAVVEGGITRMMGIFEDFDAKRIGSTRSARHYFVSFADEYDAIYVHFGQTKYATAKMKTLGIDNLSGLSALGDTVFYRDSSIKAPHNAFASYAGIMKGTKAAGYRTTLRENLNEFHFYEKETKPEGKSGKKVTLGYSSYTSPYFVYSRKKAQYYRYQFGEKHMDHAAGKQLAFKNIIIQVVEEWNIDKNGYQTMDIENTSGKGYYLTDGVMTEITWKKNENTKERTYYDKNGKELKLNKGKTFISIFPKNRLSNLVIE